MLQSILQGVMDERNLSARQVGSILDVSHTTILRALRGDRVDLDTLIKIADWLKIRPSELLDTFAEEDVESKVSVLIQAYPELQEVLEKAALAIERGEAEPAIIKDIVAYAAFRIKPPEGS